jgi:hypothetical protein
VTQPHPQPYYPPPPYAVAAAPPRRAKASWWSIVAVVLGGLNLALTAYLVIVVIRAQVALAELGRAFQGFPGNLGGLGG